MQNKELVNISNGDDIQLYVRLVTCQKDDDELLKRNTPFREQN